MDMNANTDPFAQDVRYQLVIRHRHRQSNPHPISTFSRVLSPNFKDRFHPMRSTVKMMYKLLAKSQMIN
jgi:hypothetical protein